MSPNIKWIIAFTVLNAGVYAVTALCFGPEQRGTVFWIRVLAMIAGVAAAILYEKWRIRRFTKLLMRVAGYSDLRPMWELRRVPDALAHCDRFGLYIRERPPEDKHAEFAACRTCGGVSTYREFVRMGRTSPLVFILAHRRLTRVLREQSRARGDPMPKVYLSCMMDLDHGMLEIVPFCSAVCYASYQMWVYGLPATPVERRKRSRVVAVDFVRWLFRSPAQVFRFILGRW